MRDELRDVREVVGVLQVGGDRLLVAVHRVEGHGVAVGHATGEGQRSADVAGPGPLDLDTRAPRSASRMAATGPGEELAEVQDEQAVQGSDVPCKASGVHHFLTERDRP